MQVQNNVSPIQTTPAARPEPKVARQPQADAAGARTDQVDLSPAARALQQLDKAMQESPEVREDRVNELREAIQNGTYQIDPRLIAERLLDSGHL